MRNLQQYPITKVEIVECLQELRQNCTSDGVMGDMTPAVLNKAIEIIQAQE